MLIPFASVDPHKGKLAVREARELIEHGVRGFKFHPNTQAFWPNDQRLLPAVRSDRRSRPDRAVSLRDDRDRRRHARRRRRQAEVLKPDGVDDVAADFPGLDIILAHPSFPWQEEALAIAVHKPNVYIDLSGWSPKYFPDILVQYINTRLSDKMLFGSDFPLITPDRWLSDFEKLPIKDEVRPLVLKGNAIRLLKLR